MIFLGAEEDTCGFLLGWDPHVSPPSSALEMSSYAQVQAGPGYALRSWGLTAPPKLVHRNLQDGFWRLESSNQHARDRHALHTHAQDTLVHQGQGWGKKLRDDGGERRGRHATAVPLTVH